MVFSKLSGDLFQRERERMVARKGCFLYVSDIPQVCEYQSGIVLSPCGGTFIFSFMASVPSLKLAARGETGLENCQGKTGELLGRSAGSV